MKKVVVSIVESSDGDVLLVERAKKDGVTKSFPSGDVNEGELEALAADREVFEETGQKTRSMRWLGERPSPYDPNILLSYWVCELIEESEIIPENGKIIRAWYETKDSLYLSLQGQIFQPVKDYLRII